MAQSEAKATKLEILEANRAATLPTEFQGNSSEGPRIPFPMREHAKHQTKQTKQPQIQRRHLKRRVAMRAPKVRTKSRSRYPDLHGAHRTRRQLMVEHRLRYSKESVF